MDQMTITYIITAFTGFSAVISTFMLIKGKQRLSVKNIVTTIGFYLVCIMGIYGITQGVSLLNVQTLIENMLR